ncbi:uncharacterized protein LOC144440592 [Glandiceps talaboti]
MGVTSCEYVGMYRTWLDDNDLSVPESRNDVPRKSNFKHITYERIPYPLSEKLQEVYDRQVDGDAPFPEYLIPQIPESGKHSFCEHGCQWDDGDPVVNGWICGEGLVFQEHNTIAKVNINGKQEKIKVCYRPSVGACRCVLHYDGQEDLLLNLNNHTLVHYGLLLSYLKLMKEARNPLVAFHRAYVEKLSESSRKCTPIPYHMLRLTWNAYIRLLDIDWQKDFTCEKCSDNPEIIICDGTSVGLHKELLTGLGDVGDLDRLDPIYGTKHADRVFIPSPQARKLLLQFAGVHPQSKQQTGLSPVPLSTEQYVQLISILRKYTHLSSLADVIERISNNGRQLIAPANYQSFLQDISRNSPASALLQVNHCSKARHVIKEIIIKRLDILQCFNREKIHLLRKEAPIVAKFIEEVNINGQLPYDVRCLLQEFLKKSNLPCQSPLSHQYIPVSPTPPALFDGLSFFPSMPQLHGNGNYAANTTNENRACRATDTCNKFSKGHPTLSPGIFTVYCQHKVCLGFEVMKQHESPATPFKIIKQRFQRAPRIIVYDNGCKLHQYCLNREPEFFKHTIFLVDRLHWCNHTGCSSGYNMNVYKNSEVRTLNSQICEQTNAVIARIRSQLAYMLPDNFILHTAIFLSMANNKTKSQWSPR